MDLTNCSLSNITLSEPHCPQEPDKVGNCWEATRVGETIYKNCPKTYANVTFDSNVLAPRICCEGGKWALADYDNCLIKDVESADFYIYSVGYGISAVSLIVALILIRRSKRSRCLNIYVHMNLMIAILIRCLLHFPRFIFASIKSNIIYNQNRVLYTCAYISNPMSKDVDKLDYLSVIETIIHSSQIYAMSAVASWMLVEGIHLLVVLFLTFRSHQISMIPYFLIGWVFPLLNVVISIKEVTQLFVSYNFTHDVVILAILIINVLIMLVIIYMLVYRIPHQRLRNNDTSIIVPNKISERIRLSDMKTSFRGTTRDRIRNFVTQRGGSTSLSELKKGFKAILVLFPIFGWSQLVFLHKKAIQNAKIFEIINAVIISTQGFIVSIVLCFLNKETFDRRKKRIRRNMLKTEHDTNSFK